MKDGNNLEREWVKCDFCNFNKSRILFKTKDYMFNKIPEEFSIVKCQKCNLIFTNPRLKSNVLEKYYSGILEYDNRLSFINNKERLNVFRRKDILTNFFDYPLSKKNKITKVIQYPNYFRIKRKWKNTLLIPPYIQNGYILEVGCGYGGYLYQLKRLGWNVKGLELNKKAVDFGIKKYKLDILNQSIEDFQSDRLFDIIYLQMVLEHVKSPKMVLNKCVSLLKPNGILMFSIPDFSGIEVRIYKKYAYVLQIPFHLYHFTPNSIKKYLSELNLSKIKVIHQNFDRDLIAPLFFILREHPKKLYAKYLFKIMNNIWLRKSLIKIIIDVFAFLGKTSRMTVIAKKR